jgi:hypothetical protein
MRQKKLTPEKKYLMKDALTFGIKIWIDGIKDLAFGFLVIGAAVVDMIRKPAPGGFLFYKVVKLGHRIDQAIDPYGGYEEPPSTISGTREPWDDRLG